MKLFREASFIVLACLLTAICVYPLPAFSQSPSVMHNEALDSVNTADENDLSTMPLVTAASVQDAQALSTLSEQGLKVTQLSLGARHSAAVTSDGSLWMWGSNGSGQIGDGTYTYRWRPVKVMQDVVNIEMGDLVSAAIKSDGSLWMWGNGDFAQLGNGTTYMGSNTPTKVLDDVIDVSVSDWQSAAVKSDGSLWMWGWRFHNFDNAFQNYYLREPTLIETGVADVELGTNCGIGFIKNDHTLWTWDGDRNSSFKCIFDDAAAASLNYCCTAAIDSQGSLWTWSFDGWDDEGNIIPAEAPELALDNIAKVSIGYQASLVAVAKDGTVWTWHGGRGAGSGYAKRTDINAVDIACSQSGSYDYYDSHFYSSGHAGIIKSDGTLWMWGGKR